MSTVSKKRNTIKLTTEQKQLVYNAVVNNPKLTPKNIVPLLSDTIDGITFYNIVTIHSNYHKKNTTKKPKVATNKKTSANGFDGKEKALERERKGKLILKTKTTKPFLSLPSSRCLLETALKNANYPNELILVENDDKTFFEMVNTLNVEKIPFKTLNKADLKDVIYKYGTDSLGGIDADFCNAFGNNYKEVRHILENNLVEVGGLVAFTFSYRGGMGYNINDLPTEISSLATKLFADDTRCNSDRMIDTYIRSFIGLNYEMLETNKYRDSNVDKNGDEVKGTNMISFILIRKA